jgi:hypothetical protein
MKDSLPKKTENRTFPSGHPGTRALQGSCRMKLLVTVLCVVLFGCASSSSWVFLEPPTTFVVTQRLVIDKKKPVLFVLHDKDGDWQFLADDYSPMDQAIELPLYEMVAIDSSIVQVAHLARGWKAWRTGQQSPWSFAQYK